MTRKLGYGALSAYSSGVCHYCGAPATTDDHVVPRSAFRVHQSRLPYWFRSHNTVPACRRCNEFKADYRSDCECDQCSWVWAAARAVFLEPLYEDKRRRVIRVGQSRRLR